MATPIDVTAISLYNALIASESGDPAFATSPVITNAMLTNAVASTDGKSVTGSGSMDVLMNTFMLHLDREFKNGRITGAEYTKAYIASCQSAAQGGIQFLLQKDQVYWQSINSKVVYALTKAKIATENANYISMSEQGEAQRAQTTDARSDGIPVTGLLGKQKDLYSQQITSYKRDAEVKAGKMWTDAWITMKTIDEGLLPPGQFSNAEIDEVLAAIKANNAIGN